MTAIVVGAGVGGLATAVRLAHHGLAGTVVERHASPGGRAGVWRSAGFSFDTGASLVMMTEQWHRLFQDVGRRLEDYLSLVQIDPCYRIIANHSNWWDGFFAFLVGRELGLTSHLLMDAESLGRYPVFRLAGALPLRRESGRGRYQDLAASRACLKLGAALWVFPPGARRPQGERPARLFPGAAELAVRHAAPLRICAVAFRYVYLGEQLPEAFGWLGRHWVLEPGCYGHRRSLMPVLEQDLVVAVDTLDGLLRAESLAGFRTIVEGRLSINKRMGRVCHAVGLLRGRFEPRNG